MDIEIALWIFAIVLAFINLVVAIVLSKQVSSLKREMEEEEKKVATIMVAKPFDGSLDAHKPISEQTFEYLSYDKKTNTLTVNANIKAKGYVSAEK